MSIPGVVILTALRALFSEYTEKGRAVLDSFWIASSRAEERSLCLYLSSCCILSGTLWDSARVETCFASQLLL